MVMIARVTAKLAARRASPADFAMVGPARRLPDWKMGELCALRGPIEELDGTEWMVCTEESTRNLRV
ncbi:MAG: hypothetical protein SGJ11_04195 [Phycisphaerae bacterium]|nr:hypothetical protein [Phycisphaerae bacterium]